MEQKKQIIMKIQNKVAKHISPIFNSTSNKSADTINKSTRLYIVSPFTINDQIEFIYKNAMKQNRRAYLKSRITLPALRIPHKIDSAQLIPTPLLQSRISKKGNFHTFSTVDNRQKSDFSTNSHINLNQFEEHSINISKSKPDLKCVSYHLIRAVRRCNRNLKVKLISLKK